MQRFAPVVLTLLLLAVPRSSDAEILPSQRTMQGFGSLFHSPGTRIVPGAGIPAPPKAMVVAPAPSMLPGTLCRPALAAAETRHGIQPGLLQAIGLVESGRTDEATGRREPWPWTINADGEGRTFETKLQAIAWVRQAQARGIKSIDIGCAQVNLMYHPAAFPSLELAFDPASNADYAARFLRGLRDAAPGGNWLTAAGHYHSQTPELAEPYRQRVQAAMARGAMPMAPVAALGSAAGQAQAPAAAQARSLAVAAQESPGQLLPAPAGAVGRGLDAYRASPIQMVAAVRARSTR